MGFLSSMLGGVASSLGGGLIKGLGGSSEGVGGFFSDLMAKNAEKEKDAGILSATAGANAPPTEPVSVNATGAQASKLITQTAQKMLSGIGSGAGSAISSGLEKKVASLFSPNSSRPSAIQQGQYTRDYLAAAFPEMNPWERAGTGGTMAGSADASFQNAKDLQDDQLKTQEKIARIQADTAKEVAGINSVTSRANTKDSVYAQNEMLGFNQRESQARLSSIVANTDLTHKQAAHELARTVKTQLEAQGVVLTNAQTSVLTSKFTQEIQNLRYGTSEVTRMAKDVTNMVSDAVQGLGVSDEIGAAADWVGDTWNNFWSKSDGVSGAASRK